MHFKFIGFQKYFWKAKNNFYKNIFDSYNNFFARKDFLMRIGKETRVLICGSRGAIGSSLVKVLMGKTNNIIRLARCHDQLSSKISTKICDLTKERSVIKLFLLFLLMIQKNSLSLNYLEIFLFFGFIAGLLC